MRIRVVDIWLEDLPKECEANSTHWNLIPGGFMAGVNQVLDYTFFRAKGVDSLKSADEHFKLIDYMWENGLTDELSQTTDQGDFHADHRNLTDSLMYLDEALLRYMHGYIRDFHLQPIEFAYAIRPDMIRMGIRQ